MIKGIGGLPTMEQVSQIGNGNFLLRGSDIELEKFCVEVPSKVIYMLYFTGILDCCTVE